MERDEMPETDEKPRAPRVSFNLSWFVPWTAGFLFTLGYVGPDPLLSTGSSLWFQILVWIGSWVAWPFILGHHLAS